jgi:hypothetical protein
VPALRKDTISVEFTIVPLRENGRLIAIAAIMRDVSKRFEETRALKRKLAELARPQAERPSAFGGARGESTPYFTS